MRRKKPHGNKLSAIIRFFIGLCVIMVLLFVGYYMLAVRDYSYLVRDNAVTEPAGTAQPGATPDANLLGDATPMPGQTGAEATAKPQATPTPTPVPTPTPTPTPVPTPVPTKIPEIDQSKSKTSGFKMPKPSTDGNIGISKCYVSKPDSYQIIQLTGWGYVENASFDGLQCTTYVIVTEDSTGKDRAYLATNIAGASGREHTGAGQNLSACDFQVNMNVSGYPDGVYYIGLVLQHKVDGKNRYSYYPFDKNYYAFTVLNGEVIVAVKETPVEETVTEAN